MNRPIMFRAWDNERKQMYRVEDLKFKTMPFGGDIDFPEVKVEWFEDGENRPFWIFDSKSRVELMQYTGLKDKNGKEIWEGDVVVLPDSEITPITDWGQGPEEDMNHLSPVEFKDGCFGLNVLEDSRTFCKEFWSFDSIFNGEGYKLEDLEIIGNIYENPELIK